MASTASGDGHLDTAKIPLLATYSYEEVKHEDEQDVVAPAPFEAAAAETPYSDTIFSITPPKLNDGIASAPTEDVLLLLGLNVDDDNQETSQAPVPAAVTVSSNRHDDLEAEEIAAEARQEGVNLIRGHLSTYLKHNPEADYVTWIATLHPENAQVSIDPRFLIPGNPWSTVFDEVVATMNGVVIAVDNNGQEDELPGSSPFHDHDHDESGGSCRKHDPTLHPLRQIGVEPHRTLGGLVPLTVGFSCILGAVAVAFSLQIASTIVYCVAVICYHICRILPPLHPCTTILYALPVGLMTIFRALDLLLLVMDTGLVEILAALAYIVCTPLSFSRTVGWFYHQQTRKLPHYVRWACRKPWNGVQPPRAACFVCGSSSITTSLSILDSIYPRLLIVGGTDDWSRHNPNTNEGIDDGDSVAGIP